MNSLLRGIGSGFGRVLGRVLGTIVILLVIYLLFDYFNIDIKDILNKFRGFIL